MTANDLITFTTPEAFRATFTIDPAACLGLGSECGNILQVTRTSDGRVFALKRALDSERTRASLSLWVRCAGCVHVAPAPVAVFSLGPLPQGNDLLAQLPSACFRAGFANVLFIIMDRAGPDVMEYYFPHRRPPRYTGELTRADVLAIAEQMALALSHVASCGVVHGDVKLENFLITSLNPMTVVLCDFGFARDLATQPAPLGCTLAYSAPEVLHSFEALADTGRPLALDTGAADVWALGVSVAVLLLRVHPFHESLGLVHVSPKRRLVLSGLTSRTFANVTGMRLSGMASARFGQLAPEDQKLLQIIFHGDLATRPTMHQLWLYLSSQAESTIPHSIDASIATHT
jgi:serine/threonine protein kinase